MKINHYCLLLLLYYPLLLIALIAEEEVLSVTYSIAENDDDYYDDEESFFDEGILQEITETHLNEDEEPSIHIEDHLSSTQSESFDSTFSNIRRDRRTSDHSTATKKKLDEMRSFASKSSMTNRASASSASTQSQQPSKPKSTAKPTVSTQKQPLQSNNRLKELETLFQEETRRRASQQSAIIHSEAQTKRLRRSYCIARVYAAPVERILRYSSSSSASSSSSSLSISSSSQIPNFYQLFGLKSPLSSPLSFLLEKYRYKRPYSQRLKIDQIELKKKYRQLALLVHPDKNPHPDAKAAFDFLTDAYETLSQDSQKGAYDQELWKQYSQHYHWTSKKVNRWWQDLSMNWKSQLLLTHHQWKSGEPIEVLVDLQRSWRERLEGFKELVIHLALLPSVWDRFTFVNELLWLHKFPILSFIVISHVLFL